MVMVISSHSNCFSGIVTLFSFFVLHTLASPMFSSCGHDQRDALLEFKHEFLVNESNSSSLLSSWNKSSDCCFWEGVTCDDRFEVFSLDLSSTPLNNSLRKNSGLFKLHHLRSLSLRYCNLYGEIPSSIGNLSSLTYLDLWENLLKGELPVSLGNLTQLVYLDLGKNHFSGNIPISFAKLTKLVHVNMYFNLLTSENFPLILSNLTSLSYLDIAMNRFNSTFPPDMSQFRTLEYFNAGGNSFFGSFPTSLFMIPSLTRVNLGQNHLKGPIEFRNASSSYTLQILYLYQNKFDGDIPKSISNFSNLISLALHKNNFTGPVPESISKLVNLGTLDLSYNNFTGPIPRSISKLVNLEKLDLSYNNFIGSIPRSNIAKLYDLGLSNNKLEGEIPGWLGGLSKLFLSHNFFNRFGKSFEKSFEFSNATNIQTLDISLNSFRGPLPNCICNIRVFWILDLSNNNFSGSIPQCMRNTIADLGALNLQNNNFSGSLPTDIFFNATSLVSVDVGGNQLEGQLPKTFTTCSSLKLLNVGGNRIKDKFPSWLGSLPSLNVIVLRSNEFYRLLYHPHVSIGFQSLKVIDISNNHFHGTLPPFYFSSWLKMTTLTEKDGGTYMYSGFYHNSMEMVNKGVDTNFFFFFSFFLIIECPDPHRSGSRLETKASRAPAAETNPWANAQWVQHPGNGLGLRRCSPYVNTAVARVRSRVAGTSVDTKFELIQTDFAAIDFSRNKFCGKIPISTGLLKGLHLLNLSGNGFTSSIPQSLENLTKLEALDLSQNQLSGQIPQNLGSLSFLSVMNFSYNNLQGPIPQGTQFKRQNCSAFMDNPRLYGLEDICGETYVPNPTPQKPKDWSEEPGEQVISWIAGVIAYGPGVLCGFVIGHIFSPRIHKWFR